MSQINLKLISELAMQGEQQRLTLQSYCFNPPGANNSPEPAFFMTLSKMSAQADMLFRRLKNLHQVCTDLAADNLQPYKDAHESFRGETEPDLNGEVEDFPEFEPFNELLACFWNGGITDLPPMIEQYAELKQMAAGYTKVQKKLREGFKRVQGNGGIYFINENVQGGKSIYMDSEDHLIRAEIRAEFNEIEIEYCLDGYNSFYNTAQLLIELYERDKNYRVCAAEILMMFAPYPVELTADVSGVV